MSRFYNVVRKGMRQRSPNAGEREFVRDSGQAGLGTRDEGDLDANGGPVERYGRLPESRTYPISIDRDTRKENRSR